ncbi:helix-turn-helix domain-containing protein [Sphingomonas sp. RB3P16]|uniref:helix-turn-helix domain-containing protein n=1 Tax=Parasphingomonas frigoris TaxID=3096163 RepID=UPI003FA7A1A7
MDDIRTARQTLAVTQSELAGMLGLHQSTISRFENGDLAVDERTRLALDALIMRRHAAAVAEVDGGGPRGEHVTSNSADRNASSSGTISAISSVALR